MSSLLEKAAASLQARTSDTPLDFSVKFDIDNEGCIIADHAGVRVADEDADLTISAGVDTFQSLLEGDLDPTSAFMSGKIKIEGDISLAMRLAGVFR